MLPIWALNYLIVMAQIKCVHFIRILTSFYSIEADVLVYSPRRWLELWEPPIKTTSQPPSASAWPARAPTSPSETTAVSHHTRAQHTLCRFVPACCSINAAQSAGTCCYATAETAVALLLTVKVTPNFSKQPFSSRSQTGDLGSLSWIVSGCLECRKANS